MGKLERFTEWLSVASTVVDSWNLLSYVVSVVSGGGTVAAALNGLPAYVPISLAAITIASLVFSITRTIVRYKRWVRIQNDPNVVSILKTLWEMHQLMGTLSAGLRGLSVSQATIKSCGSAIQRLIGVDADAYAKLAQQSYDHAFQHLYKRSQRVYKYKIKEILTLTTAFSDVGKEMDRVHIGISRCKRNQKYQSLYTQLKGYEFQLNLTNPERVYSIDQALELSFGLYSLALSLVFMKRSPAFVQAVPRGYMKSMEDSAANVDGLFTVALMQLKAVLIDDMVRSKL